MNDLTANKLSAYNGACAFSSLVNGACKIEAAKVEILERLAALPRVEEKSDEEQLDYAERQLQRKTAEKLCLSLVRMKIAQDQEAQERKDRENAAP